MLNELLGQCSPVFVGVPIVVALIAMAVLLYALLQEVKNQAAALAHVWSPIETAPRDGKRPLYLATLGPGGDLIALDHDGRWDLVVEGGDEWYDWVSANGIEAPTHWALQEYGPPPVLD